MITMEQREKIKAAHLAYLEAERTAEATPQAVRARALYELYEMVVLDAGEIEPESWCEGCGLPFFEGDDYLSGEDGAACRSDGSCLMAPSGDRP